MAMTTQGAFDETYHHIEAPTYQDDAFGEKYYRRKLLVPKRPSHFRDPAVGFLADSVWVSRRKLDGANLRVKWNGEQALWNGKSDNFTCGQNLRDYMSEVFLEEIFEEKFGRDKTVVLFGEHMGPKVQKNELDISSDQFVLYDVRVNGFWLDKQNVREVATYFGVKTCYDYMDRCYPRYSLYDLIAEVSNGGVADWEGIVATPEVEMRNQRGDRIIVKIKNRDYNVPAEKPEKRRD